MSERIERRVARLERQAARTNAAQGERTFLSNLTIAELAIVQSIVEAARKRSGRLTADEVGQIAALVEHADARAAGSESAPDGKETP